MDNPSDEADREIEKFYQHLLKAYGLVCIQDE
jgi:hypothetical protein